MEKLKNLFTKPVHPFLLCIFFILNTIHVYNLLQNDEITSYDIIKALLITIISAFIIYLFILFLIKDCTKAGLITSLFLLINLFYGNIASYYFLIKPIKYLVEKFLFNKQNTCFIIILLFVFIAFCFFIIKSKRAFTNITIYLNTLIITLIIIESIKVFINISSPAQDYKLGLKNTINPEELQLKVGPDTAPDIYYIVLDSYTSSKSLKEFWNYDNSEFTDYLKSKGFYIAEDSKSPYPYTNISIPSTLNMSYIYQGTDWKKLLKYSIVINLLTSNGYDFINFSLFDIGTQEKYYIFPDSGNYPSVIFNKTIPATIINRILERQMGDINLEIFSKIKEISSSKHKKPVLVYGHLMMPHAFYLFDEHGNRMPETYFSDIYDKNKYLKQLIFTNKLAIDCVETILSKSVNKPIIIIKGDHGARIFKSPGEEDTYKKEAFSIFNAYYLPDGGNKLLYSSISQVNDFRIIFNYYFHTKLKLIK